MKESGAFPRWLHCHFLTSSQTRVYFFTSGEWGGFSHRFHLGLYHSYRLSNNKMIEEIICRQRKVQFETYNNFWIKKKIVSPCLEEGGLRAMASSVAVFSGNHCLWVHSTQGLDLLDSPWVPCSGPGNSMLGGMLAVLPRSKAARAPISFITVESMCQNYLTVGAQTSALTVWSPVAVPLLWSPQVFLHKLLFFWVLLPPTQESRLACLRVSYPCLTLAIHPLLRPHWAREISVSTVGI